jgi:transposase
LWEKSPPKNRDGQVYVTQGFLAIDNNAAERQMKLIATGRKNWLFAGTEDGARAAATFYTLLASAKRHDLDPLEYLADVLARLPALPMSQLPQLLPDEWKKARAAAAAAGATSTNGDAGAA